jgi:hypothetical protein
MREAKLLPRDLSWDDVVRNIEPIAPLAREAWERAGQHPAAAAFSDQAADIRGAVMWDHSKFSRK